MFLGEAIHVGLCVVDACVSDRSREGNQRLIRVAFLYEIGIKGQLVPHRVEPGSADNHRFSFVSYAVGRLAAEMLHHDLDFLANRMLMKINFSHSFGCVA